MWGIGDKWQRWCAQCYFNRRIRRVQVNHGLGWYESFAAYLDHRYRDNCYYYSGYAIMGLLGTDFLVRGGIQLENDFAWRRRYDHGWVEFCYRQHWWVFDSLLSHVVRRRDYYARFRPQLTFRLPQREIVERLLSEVGTLTVNDYRLQHVRVEQTSDDRYFTSSVYGGGRLWCRDGEVTEFIAFDPPSF